MGIESKCSKGTHWFAELWIMSIERWGTLNIIYLFGLCTCPVCTCVRVCGFNEREERGGYVFVFVPVHAHACTRVCVSFNGFLCLSPGWCERQPQKREPRPGLWCHCGWGEWWFVLQTLLRVPASLQSCSAVYSPPVVRVCDVNSTFRPQENASVEFCPGCRLNPIMGYGGCRNEGLPCWEPSCIKGSLFS